MNKKLLAVSSVLGLVLVAGVAVAASRGPSSDTAGVFAPSNTVLHTPGRTAHQDSGLQQVPPKAAKDATKLDTEYAAGYSAFTKKDYTGAIQIENRVIQADATYEKAYNVKGIALLFSGKYDEGMQAIDKALELNPADGYARFNQALGFELFGHFDDAIKAYKQALQISHGGWWQAWCYYGIASIYGRRGDVGDTVNYLKQAIQLDASTKQAAKTEQDFDNVRHSPAFQKLITTG